MAVMSPGDKFDECATRSGMGYSKAAQAAGARANRKLAKDRALVVLPWIEDLQQKGLRRLDDIANELNRVGVKYKDGRWHAMTVWRVLRYTKEERTAREQEKKRQRKLDHLFGRRTKRMITL